MKNSIKILSLCVVMMFVFAGVSFAETKCDNLSDFNRIKNLNPNVQKTNLYGNRKANLSKIKAFEGGCIDALEGALAGMAVAIYECFVAITQGTSLAKCQRAVEMNGGDWSNVVDKCLPLYTIKEKAQRNFSEYNGINLRRTLRKPNSIQVQKKA